MNKQKIIEIEDGACYLWLQNMITQQSKESEQKEHIDIFLNHLYTNVLPEKIVNELKNVDNMSLFLKDKIQRLIIDNYNLKIKGVNSGTEKLIIRLEINELINKKYSCLYEKLLRSSN